MADEVWRPGDLVRVLAGPFAGLMGTVEEVSAESARLRVHLTVMGSACHVELDFGDVEAYDPAHGPADSARWRRGDAVRVLAGRYQFLTGIVQVADDESEHVVVRLAGLRPEVYMEFDYSDIESA